MLTFSEFKNILQLIASDDLECNILGQELAWQYRFGTKSSFFNDIINLGEHYIIYGDQIKPLWHGKNMSYEQAYEKYLTCPHTRGI